MFNKNYMKHNLIPYQENLWSGKSSKCTKCNSHILYYNDDDDSIEGGLYRILYIEYNFIDYDLFKINCDEMIIKGIVE